MMKRWKEYGQRDLDPTDSTKRSEYPSEEGEKKKEKKVHVSSPPC
jgi:hypothetical protein